MKIVELEGIAILDFEVDRNLHHRILPADFNSDVILFEADPTGRIDLDKFEFHRVLSPSPGETKPLQKRIILR